MEETKKKTQTAKCGGDRGPASTESKHTFHLTRGTLARRENPHLPVKRRSNSRISGNIDFLRAPKNDGFPWRREGFFSNAEKSPFVPRRHSSPRTIPSHRNMASTLSLSFGGGETRREIMVAPPRCKTLSLSLCSTRAKERGEEYWRIDTRALIVNPWGEQPRPL